MRGLGATVSFVLNEYKLVTTRRGYAIKGEMSSVLQFLLALAIILVAAKMGGYLTARLGQPAVLGELLAGVLLGPTALDLLHWFPSHFLEEIFHHLAELGVVVLMFLAGLETKLDDLKSTKNTAILSGTLGVVVPLGFALAVGPLFGFDLQHSFFLGLVLAATSVSISARTLMELNALRGREGVSILGAAVVDDVLVILLLSIFVAVAVGSGGSAEPNGELMSVVIILARMVAFFAIAIAAGFLLVPRLARIAANLPVSENLATFGLVMMLVYAWSAEVLGGVAMITGAFLVGLALGRTEFRHKIEERTHTLAYAFLVPVFFINIGLAANLRAFSAEDVVLLVVLSVGAVLSKVLGGGGGARASGLNWLQSLRVGVGMVSRGEVGLIVASVGVNAGLINQNVFSIFVVVVVVTTVLTPLLLKWVFSERKEEVEGAHA